MAGRIPQTFIDELLSRVDIVELIDARVPLKKKGRDYMACCPFHSEKSASFSVSPTKQFFHCFGCGAHGTALGFLMDYDRLEFLDAVRALADHAGMQMPDTGGGKSDGGAGLAPLFALLDEAVALYKRTLKDSARGIDYLKGRGVSGEIAADFALGYAPDAWQTVVDALGRDAAARDGLVATGLAIRRDDGGLYDRFRDRVMFPIRDARGRCIGFGGRILDQGEPKYLNSPETPLFHKGRELYGLYEARQADRNLTRRIQVLHSVGGAGAGVAEAYRAAGLPHHVVPFLREIGTAYKTADLVVSRAGALTCAELEATGAPAVLVPYPHHADRQQFKNAEPLAARGGAVILEEKALSPAAVREVILRLLADPPRLAEMSRKMASGARDATTEVAADLLAL